METEKRKTFCSSVFSSKYVQYLYNRVCMRLQVTNYGKRIKPFYTKEWVFPNGQIHFTTWPARR